jgi:hypothetical protein
MGIVDNFKDVFKVADTLNNLELYEKLGELQTRVMEVEEENRALREQLREKTSQEDLSSKLQFRDNAYYIAEPGKPPDGPYCMRCWDADRKLIRERAGATPGRHFCPHCAYGKRP